jgi:hypothetical protein
MDVRGNEHDAYDFDSYDFDSYDFDSYDFDSYDFDSYDFDSYDFDSGNVSGPLKWALYFLHVMGSLHCTRDFGGLCRYLARPDARIYLAATFQPSFTC